MGTARAPVAGSGDWPACTAWVASWYCLGSDMMVSFRFVGLLLGNGKGSRGPQRKRPASALGPGPLDLKNRLRCYRMCRSKVARTGPPGIHMAMTSVPYSLEFSMRQVSGANCAGVKQMLVVGFADSEPIRHTVCRHGNEQAYKNPSPDAREVEARAFFSKEGVGAPRL